ncbi:formate dehydrogenase accessory sulfurtransferase FdhD [Salsipaludibacter albus]|uniref:formate dehydrogenase accessory sulfurtransferase FdhD n=1 Tax=Salsipaludibacter albus TaxID=2849650 RepID=UPI001EE4316A|nr:formate dehydrogenase accessory sulfurtransferase FdhD [Salsipaludibacter albus]MBY5163379.1 formate dehydrogenase accessory sulfurtransferase FdhD [Salsipaludibacter albus]
MTERPSTHQVTVRSLDGRARADVVAIEEPLTIRLATLAGATSDVAVTMRTPGHDDELAVGWLVAEGILSGRRDVVDVAPCALGADDDAVGNAVQVTLAADRLPDLSSLDRHGLVTSACGVCGRRTLEALADSGITPVASRVTVDADVVRGLGASLRAAQPTFGLTGGVHAAAAATPDGDLVDLREDVGRHNALDKLVGSAVLDGRSLAEHVLVLSGRASYELLMKAAVARMEVVVAMGAASSLAVDVADAFALTLVGFAAGRDPNVHTRPDRVRSAP